MPSADSNMFMYGLAWRMSILHSDSTVGIRLASGLPMPKRSVNIVPRSVPLLPLRTLKLVGNGCHSEFGSLLPIHRLSLPRFRNHR